MFALTFSKKHLRIQVYCRDGFHPKVLQFLFVWCCNALKLGRRFESFIAAFESLEADNNNFTTIMLTLHVAHCFEFKKNKQITLLHCRGIFCHF